MRARLHAAGRSIRSRIARNLVGYVALGVAITAAGGVAYSAIPDPQGVIHSCYDENTGAMRLTDPQDGVPRPCQGGETTLDWNQRGPAGPPGPPGPPGEPSAVEDSAPAPTGFDSPTRKLKGKAKKRAQSLATKGEDDAAFSTWSDTGIAVPEGAGALTVAHLDVPAGKYAVVAKAFVVKRASFVKCQLQAGGDYDTMLLDQGSGTLTVVHPFAHPGRIELRCYQHAGWEGHPNSELMWLKVTAMQFDELTNKPL